MELLHKKVVVEFRFIPILRFREIVDEFFQLILGDYYELTENESLVRLRDPGRCVEIFHARNRAGIAVENIDDDSILRSELLKLYKLIEHCGVKKITRFGVRSLLIAGIENLEYLKAIAKYAENMLQKDNLLINYDELTDFGLTLTGSHSGSTVKMNTGIVNPSEIAVMSTFKLEGDPDVALLIDVDRYSMDKVSPFRQSEAMERVRENKNLASSYLEKISGLFD